MDAATGLLYVGNGQYYDPETGRFLTRDAKPNQTNPYTPWDPMGSLFAPLGLLAMFYSRKKKGGKWGMWIALLLVVMSVGMVLSACGPYEEIKPGPIEVDIVTTTPGQSIGIVKQDGTVVGTIQIPTNTPLPTLVATLCTPTQTPTPPTGTPTPTPTPSVKLTERAQIIRGWAAELGYSTTDVLAILLNREALNPSLEDSRWFNGGVEDPAEIYKEAATRWYWSWIKDATIISIYGMASNDTDREAMAYQWIVNAMQSEDGWTKDILRSQHDTLRPEFVRIANSVIHPSDSEWAKGDGSWGWANQYLYANAAREILNEENLYHWGSGPTTWYIINDQTLRKVCKYNLYIDTSRC
jgi:hypothetical protein